MKDRLEKLSEQRENIKNQAWDFVNSMSNLPDRIIPRRLKRESEHRMVEADGNDEEKKGFFAKFKAGLVRRFDKMRTGFRIHSAVYGSVNGLLFALNMLTSPGFPWFLFPLGAWGMGLAIHYGAYSLFKNKKEQIERYEYLSPEQFKTLEKFLNSKRAIGMHAWASVSVVAYLAMVNIITGFGFPWFLIVAAALGVPLVINGAIQKAYQSSLKDKLKRLLKGVTLQRSVPATAEGPEEYEKALLLRTRILKSLEKGSKEQKALIPEMMPVLDQYTEAIRELSVQANKYGVLLESCDPESIRKEKDKIHKRLETVKTESLKREYQKAVEHLEKQDASYSVLSEREELIRLRIKSTLSLMEKLNMDLVMMEDVSTHMTVLANARKKAEELEQYSQDLEEGFRILEEEL